MNNLKNKESDMAIVIVSYDGYSDLWNDYFTLLNKYWINRNYNTYLVNNTKRPYYDNVKVINCGKYAQWSTRTRTAIEQIDEPYICLLLEDFFTGSQIDDKTIEDTVEFIKSEQIKYYKLNTFSKIKTDKYKGIDYLYRIPSSLEYGISLQPAIWEKKFLLELLGDGDYNAWKFELDRVVESDGSDSRILEGCLFDNRNILNICHGVVQGKFLPPAVRYFKKNDYNLNTKDRPIMEKSEYIIYKMKGIGKQIIPKKYRKYTKNVMNKFGIEFILK